MPDGRRRGARAQRVRRCRRTAHPGGHREPLRHLPDSRPASSWRCACPTRSAVAACARCAASCAPKKTCDAGPLTSSARSGGLAAARAREPRRPSCSGQSYLITPHPRRPLSDPRPPPARHPAGRPRHHRDQLRAHSAGRPRLRRGHRPAAGRSGLVRSPCRPPRTRSWRWRRCRTPRSGTSPGGNIDVLRTCRMPPPARSSSAPTAWRRISPHSIHRSGTHRTGAHPPKPHATADNLPRYSTPLTAAEADTLAQLDAAFEVDPFPDPRSRARRAADRAEAAGPHGAHPRHECGASGLLRGGAHRPRGADAAAAQLRGTRDDRHSRCASIDEGPRPGAHARGDGHGRRRLPGRRHHRRGRVRLPERPHRHRVAAGQGGTQATCAPFRVADPEAVSTFLARLAADRGRHLGDNSTGDSGPVSAS